ncbi:hypothetical protein HP439_17665, partial [Sphingobacterium shayense]|uniref:hypothetical protein n=1 Tax=Sphingobacterium shayense TaxID=626343 RepID=UPI0015536BCE
LNPLNFDDPIEELIEALFLEPRKPILLVDSKSALQIIARLYKVLWPSLRKKFAACTLALSPRTVNNRPFDLMFSTSYMLTRFADWSGRRIQGGETTKKSARHRWTNKLYDRIFKNSDPSLHDRSILSLFDFISAEDESTLRLNLLWEELLDKAKIDASPIAILGLLDIINSQPVFAPELYKGVEPYIRHAVDVAQVRLVPSDAWKFYAGLLVKHKKKLMGRQLLLDVKSACTVLTRKDADVAIDFIVNFDQFSNRVPSVLFSSIGNGLTDSLQDSGIQVIEDVPHIVGLHLLATSREFSKTLMSLIESNQDRISAYIERSLSVENAKAISRAKNNLLIYINNKAQSAIVSALFDNASIEIYERVLLRIAENTNFGIREFDRTILESTKLHNKTEVLLDIVSAYNHLGQANSLMTKILLFDLKQIQKFIQNSSLEKPVRNDVLCEVMNQMSIEQLTMLAHDKRIARKILSIIAPLKSCDQMRIAIFILLADVPFQEAINRFVKLPQTVISKLQAEEFKTLVEKLISNFDPIIAEIFLKKISPDQADYIIQIIFNPQNQLSNVEIIFTTVLNISSLWKKLIVKYIDVISEVLANSLNKNIDIELSNDWAETLRLSSDYGSKQKAAFHVLRYVYQNQIVDPSKLLISAFPIVYDSFLTGRNFFQVVAYLAFPDWDKCKTLRYDLVARYLDSTWPPLGIFQIAKKSGILKEIIYILSNSKKGIKFLERAYQIAITESGLLDKTTIKRIKKHVVKK